MTEAEKIRAVVAYRLEQAEEALRSAELNLEQELIRSAVNRAYYAMFYGVLALLATRKAETAKHSGAISLFDRDFVKPGIFKKDFSRWLHQAFSERQDADYATEFERSMTEAEELNSHARQFVTRVEGWLAKSGHLSRP